MSTLIQEEKIEPTEVGINVGDFALAFCLENGMHLGQEAYIGNAALQIGSISLIKDAP